MKRDRLQSASPSPYEVALTGNVAVYGMVIAGVAFFFLRLFYLTAILFILAVALGWLFDRLGRCPVCGKTPVRGARRDGQAFDWYLGIRFRGWPERQCSKCGTRLDGAG
jgi:hypothetical protein